MHELRRKTQWSANHVSRSQIKIAYNSIKTLQDLSCPAALLKASCMALLLSY